MPETDTEKGAPPFPSITLVEDDWLEDFNDFDGTDAEKRELIQALWMMLLTCVDLCMSLPSPQETRGQPIQLTDLLVHAVLYSEGGNQLAEDEQKTDTKEDV